MGGPVRLAVVVAVLACLLPPSPARVLYRRNRLALYPGQGDPTHMEILPQQLVAARTRLLRSTEGEDVRLDDGTIPQDLTGEEPERAAEHAINLERLAARLEKDTHMQQKQRPAQQRPRQQEQQPQPPNGERPHEILELSSGEPLFMDDDSWIPQRRQ